MAHKRIELDQASIEKQLLICDRIAAKLDADPKPKLAMVDTYGIMQAPTLVVVNNGEVKKYVNASDIKGYVQSLR